MKGLYLSMLLISFCIYERGHSTLFTCIHVLQLGLQGLALLDIPEIIIIMYMLNIVLLILGIVIFMEM